MPTEPKSAPGRIETIDQLRGYAIAGMMFVNYLGQFEVMPWMMKHHRTGMSYADTIAPLFMFVVGMGFRLSFLRKLEKTGIWRARWDAIKRYIALTLVGIAFAGPDYRSSWWDALADIGLAGVVSLPFIERSAPVRAAAAFIYVGIYQLIHMFTPYGAWEMEQTINGGPLGPVSYAFVLLMGTLAYDLIASGNRKKILSWGAVGAVGLALLGLILKFPWAGIKSEWPFSQYYMTAPYPIYSTGLAFAAFLAFYCLCDIAGTRIPTLSILGENALVMYLLHNELNSWWGNTPPHDSPVWKAAVAFAILYLACYTVARKLHKDRIIIKL
ncbi:DUF1624 domain-containing protein [Candidatus Sumerlaeota bacterium]|nr:DUF1624 domain-containing protein [Candidatus Sumerlaeota bacterium]